MTAPGDVRSDPSTMRAATKTLAARSRAQHSRAASWSAVVSGRTGRRWRSTLTACPSGPAVSRRARERWCAILGRCTLPRPPRRPRVSRSAAPTAWLASPAGLDGLAGAARDAGHRGAATPRDDRGAHDGQGVCRAPPARPGRPRAAWSAPRRAASARPDVCAVRAPARRAARRRPPAPARLAVTHARTSSPSRSRRTRRSASTSSGWPDTGFAGFDTVATHPSERSADLDDRARAVSWVRKEAALKALGVGFVVDPASLDDAAAGPSRRGPARHDAAVERRSTSTLERRRPRGSARAGRGIRRRAGHRAPLGLTAL